GAGGREKGGAAVGRELPRLVEDLRLGVERGVIHARAIILPEISGMRAEKAQKRWSAGGRRIVSIRITFPAKHAKHAKKGRQARRASMGWPLPFLVT